MQLHSSRLPIAVLTACLALASGVWLMQAAAFVRAAPVMTETPVVTGVSPDAAPNDVDTDVTIHGSGFSAVLSGTQVITPPAVWLGDTPLAAVTWANTST